MEKRKGNEIIAEQKAQLIRYHVENGLSHPDLQDEIDKAKELTADTEKMLTEAIQRMYDRYVVVTTKPESLKFFTGTIIAGGLTAVANQLVPLEKALGIT